MPVIKSAAKKLRQTIVKTERNRSRRRALKEMVDAYKKSPSVKSLSAAFSKIDKVAKTGVIHKNKAARLKSRLSKKLAVHKSK